VTPPPSPLLALLPGTTYIPTAFVRIPRTAPTTAPQHATAAYTCLTVCRSSWARVHGGLDTTTLHHLPHTATHTAPAAHHRCTSASYTLLVGQVFARVSCLRYRARACAVGAHRRAAKLYYRAYYAIQGSSCWRACRDTACRLPSRRAASYTFCCLLPSLQTNWGRAWHTKPALRAAVSRPQHYAAFSAFCAVLFSHSRAACLLLPLHACARLAPARAAFDTPPRDRCAPH